jgi:hypothetical protein
MAQPDEITMPYRDPGRLPRFVFLSTTKILLIVGSFSTDIFANKQHNINSSYARQASIIRNFSERVLQINTGGQRNMQTNRIETGGIALQNNNNSKYAQQINNMNGGFAWQKNIGSPGHQVTHFIGENYGIAQQIDADGSITSTHSISGKCGQFQYFNTVNRVYKETNLPC